MIFDLFSVWEGVGCVARGNGTQLFVSTFSWLSLHKCEVIKDWVIICKEWGNCESFMNSVDYDYIMISIWWQALCTTYVDYLGLELDEWGGWECGSCAQCTSVCMPFNSKFLGGWWCWRLKWMDKTYSGTMY